MSEVDQATINLLNKSKLYIQLAASCRDDKDGHTYLSLVERTASYANQRTKTILRHMGEFTLHDSDHLFQVLEIIELLLGETNIQHLSTPEIGLLIISAFFHDIGMAPDEHHVQAWKKIWDKAPQVSVEEIEQFEAFQRFALSRPDRMDLINNLVIQGELTKAELQKCYLVSDYIRNTHAIRSREIVERDWASRFDTVTQI